MREQFCRCLPRQRSGPRRQNDRETVAAFLFAEAAGVSLDCLPDCGFPSPLTLHTTAGSDGARAANSTR